MSGREPVQSEPGPSPGGRRSLALATPKPASPSDAVELAFETIAHHSKSFALASMLLPFECRAAAAVLYAWCRRVDDAVDLAPDRQSALSALARERADLSRVYADDDPRLRDPILAAFREVVRRHAIPRRYAEELLEGMEMDVRGTEYATVDALLLYCFRVAGTVGLMMSHIMGVSDRRALVAATHLGIGMQLTNICRDVREDWERGRLYLPAELVGPQPGPGESLDRERCRHAVRELLALAERYYASADGGLPSLSWRCALAVRTARLVYSRIGRVIAARGWDALQGRAVVPGPLKLWLVVRAVGAGALEKVRGRPRFVPVALPLVEDNDDVIRL